jgi:hypothetical protein
MKKLFSSLSVLFASAALFAAGVLSQSKCEPNLAAPTSITVIVDHTLASGPTIPPGPWDEEETGSGDTKIASGPTIPPGPWDEEETGSGDTKIASGPTIPPGPWDEEESGPGDTKVV